jgi:hypothetical protein
MFCYNYGSHLFFIDDENQGHLNMTLIQTFYLTKRLLLIKYLNLLSS